MSIAYFKCLDSLYIERSPENASSRTNLDMLRVGNFPAKCIPSPAFPINRRPQGTPS